MQIYFVMIACREFLFKKIFIKIKYVLCLECNFIIMNPEQQCFITGTFVHSETF